MSSIVNRSRNIRSGRSVRGKARKETLDKDVILDWSKGPRENLKTILSSICMKTGITNGQRLSYLNFFTKFCSKVDVINSETVGFSVEEILYCLRVTLFIDSAEVRAAGLRAVRYLLTDKESVEALYRINFHILIARSLDIELNNLAERIQCLRLVRKLLAVKPEAVPPAIMRSVIAIARDGFIGPDEDSMCRACMGCLGELILLNPLVCCQSGGITALIDCVLMTHQSLHISEALVGCLIFILNDPRLRCYLRKDIDLRQFVAPFTDCHYSLPLLALNTQRRDDISETSEQRETRLNTAKIALISILRSWPGIIYICKLNDNPESFNSLCSLIEMLHLPYKDIRKHIIELVFELFYLTVPSWTADFSAALESCSSSVIQDNWHLYDGFVAAEGRCILPHVSKERTNLIDNYLSLLLYTFLTNGLLDGLVDVIIVPSDTENSVRAILLVGELLHLSSHLLPTELAQQYYSLPKLVEAALSTDNTPEQRDIASRAINCLNRIHATKKSRTIPHSLYLNQLIYFCKASSSKGSSLSFLSSPSSTYDTSTSIVNSATTTSFYSHKSSKAHQSNQSLSFKFKNRSSSFYSLNSNRKENDEATLIIYIRDSQVLKSDPNKWDWNLIGCILKSPSDSIRKLDDINNRNFVKQILNYFKPTSHLFSKLRTDDENGYEISTVGTYLIDFLLECDEIKVSEYIWELLGDIRECLSQVTSESNAMPDSILNCTNILRTWSHTYFLFIGRFTATAKGSKFLEKIGIYQQLEDLVDNVNNDCYLKLIVSSLNYCHSDNLSRSLFIKILTCKMESARLYATNYIRVLLRAGFSDFRKWALELLTQQLSDESQAVVLAAIDILDEACDSIENLEALISLQPNLLRVGDRGLLLLIRYLSIPNGFKFLRDTNFLSYEIDRWRKYFNLKYVRIVENSLNEALSYHQRNEHGSYGRRSDKKTNYKKSVYLPAHLYGELVKQEDGYNLIIQENFLGPMLETIRDSNMSTELSVLQLKAALWAIGTVGSSPTGFKLIAESKIIETIVKLTRDSPVLSIRGTGFFVLGLLATTDAGADYLKNFGWENVRYMGICLPIDLELIFHKKDKDERNEDEDERDRKPSSNLTQYHLVRQNDKYQTRINHKPNITSSSRRGLADESGFEFHNSTNCLLCSHAQTLNSKANLSSQVIKETDNEVNHENEDNPSSSEKYDMHKKQATLQEPYFPSCASSSPEIRNNSLPKNSRVECIAEMRREVIRSVSYLLGWFEVIKLAEQNLLSLKQKYPMAFQDICLYSEISIQLASYNFRLPARRFLQELFMDLNYEQLFPDVEAMYEKNKPLLRQFFDYTS
ncbi:rapamycin-insensitive companion of mTOR [Tetranychus urticae]|uniref:rapamycin-insensitive companion of mTOR n=1 Tax=Tetranychus urticae TaxID=32264 RepID=UPI00077BB544|nr:rapamycin-insensitive companion of mTOR [Tetranychus urticae]